MPQTCALSQPHRLSSIHLDDCPWLSDFLASSNAVPHLLEISERKDLLDMLSSRQNIQEAAQPSAVLTKMKR